MPHEDGAAYFPLVATVSLGADIVLDLYSKHDDLGQDQVGHCPDGNVDGEEESKKDMVAGDTGNMEVQRRPRFRVLQERRSLLITRGSIYTDFLHGIAETTRDEDLGPHSICNWDLLREADSYRADWYQRETRISLTYRDVLKVAKMGNAMKFLKGR